MGNAGSTVTGYPLSASGDPKPSTDLSQSANVGSLAFDSAGDLWVGEGEGELTDSGTIEEYSPSQLGSSGSVTPTISIAASVGVDSGSAFDASGDLWFAGFGGNSVSEYTASQLSGSGTKAPTVTLSGLSSADGVAFDPHGDLWVSSYDDNTVSEFTAAELAASGSPTPAVVISGSALDQPARITFDTAGNLWVPNYSGDTIAEYSAAQLTASGSPAPATVISSNNGSLSEPNGLDFDAGGDLWVINEAIDAVVEFSPSQIAASGSPVPLDTIAGEFTDIVNPYVLAVGPSPATPTPTTTTPTPSTPTPTTPPTTAPLGRPKLSVGTVGAGGDALTVTLTCAKGAAACASASITGTVIEHLKGHTVIVTTALASRKRTRTTSRVVPVASGKVTLAAGTRRTVKLKLNATGRTLLAKFHKLTVLTTVSVGGKPVRRVKVVLRAQHQTERNR